MAPLDLFGDPNAYKELPADLEKMNEDDFKNKLFDSFGHAMMALANFYTYNDYAEPNNQYMLRILDTVAFVSERMKDVKKLCIDEKCKG